MWWRALLAAAAVTCTVTLAQGPPPLNQIKDILCVMLLNSIQKEDMSAMTRSLQTVNTSENNDVPTNIQRIIELTMNKTDTTKIIMENGNSSDNVQLELNNKTKYIETYLKQPNENNKNHNKVVDRRTEKYLPDDRPINCDSLMDNSKGKPTILSVVHFWRDCLNISRPIESYAESFTFKNTSISMKFKNNTDIIHEMIYTTTPPQVNVDENNEKLVETLPNGNRRYNVEREMRPKDQFLKSINDFYKKALVSGRKSGNSLNVYKGGNVNDLYEKSTKDLNEYIPSYITSNSQDIHLKGFQNKPISPVNSTKIGNTNKSENSLYYDEYEENNYVNSKDLTVPLKNYQSGYRNIFYAYNESNINMLETNPDPFKHVLRNLAKITNNNLFGDKNWKSQESKLNIISKLNEVLILLENTADEGLHTFDNRPNTDAIVRQFSETNETPTNVLRQKSIKLPESTRQNLKNKSTTDAEVVSFPSVHYVNYLPPVTNYPKVNFTTKTIPTSVYDDLRKYLIDAAVIAINNNAPKDYFYPKNSALQKIINYKGSEPYKDTAMRQLIKNIWKAKQNEINLNEPIKSKIKTTSAEIVTVSSIHYANYLYPGKNINNLSGPNSSKISKLVPQLHKKYIYDSETDGRNYYQYEKINVKVVASNHNLNQKLFYPEISSHKLDIIKPGLSTMYFTPYVLERGNNKLRNYAFGSKPKQEDSLTRNIPVVSDFDFYLPNGNYQNVDSDNSANLFSNKSTSHAKQSEQNETSDKVTWTQKYTNATDRRMNTDVKINNKATIDKNNIVITDIARSVKAVILEDLRKELNIPLYTKPETTINSIPTIITTPTTKISETAMQFVSTTYKIVTQDTVMDKIMKFLEQMNTSKKSAQYTADSFLTSSKNMKMLNKDVEILTTESYYLRTEKRQKNKHPASRDYNFKLQKHKNRLTVHKEIKRQQKYKLKDKKILEPKTFQTNELQISPLGVYVNSFISPINQNIIVSPLRKERGQVNTGNDRNHYIEQTSNPFLRNYNPNNIRALTGDVRASLHNNIYSNTNDNYENDNKHESVEHKDVKYLDDKFLNKVVKDSTVLELPPNRDCCNQEYVSQLIYECCNDKVVARRQKSLIKNEPNDDSNYRNFLQSQHKVNAILGRVLASRTKFRSVESI